MNKINLGISACLVGQKTRYDGADKLDRFLVEALSEFVEFVPVCPEVECGLGVPREAMHLIGHVNALRLVTIQTGVDMTSRMEQWASRRVKELESVRQLADKQRLRGFVFKANSPSCGVGRVPVYSSKGAEPVCEGVGLFARMLMERFPALPVEEDERLHDPKILDDFIQRLFAAARRTSPNTPGR